MGKILIGIIILLLGGAGFYIYNRSTLPAPTTENMEVEREEHSEETTGTTTEETSGTPTSPVTDNPSGTSSVSPTTETVKEFTVDGKNFSLTPATITVNKGDRVRITFKNSGGTHDFVIDEFNVATERIASGQSETVEFLADKTGSFEYYCSVGSHRAMGMKGTLTVQ